MIAAAKRVRGRVWDLDTDREVPDVFALEIYDPATGRGELSAYKVDRQGRRVVNEQGNWITYRATGRFKFVPFGTAVGQSRVDHSVVMGAPRCAKCPSHLVLRGDDLCPACRARERGQRHPMRVERIRPEDVLLGHKCKLCTRDAVFSVADEVTVTPFQSRRPFVLPAWLGPLGVIEIKRPLYDRGATVGRHYYCEWCFKPPRLLDARGEVIRDIEENTLRP